MVKTFLYHGYLDPFTKIDFSVHLPIAVGFFYVFFLDHLPSGYHPNGWKIPPRLFFWCSGLCLARSQENLN
jgi:hypothetical protein